MAHRHGREAFQEGIPSGAIAVVEISEMYGQYSPIPCSPFSRETLDDFVVALHHHKFTALTLW